MSSFTITSNVYLRTIYGNNRDLASKAKRADASPSKLSSADSAALRKGIAALADFDYKDKTNDTEKDKSKGKLFNTMRAFSDAYNNTLQSAGASKNSSMSKIAKQIKNLSKEHADELSTYGITFDGDGYMTVKGSAVDNIASSKFESVVGKDSAYMKKLSEYAKKLSRHIDAAV